MPEDKSDQKLGLAGASTFPPTCGLGGGDGHTDPQVIADMAKMEELRLSLDRLTERLSQQPAHGGRLAVTRLNIIELLDCLHATLNNSLLCGVLEAEDLVVLYDHPSMTLLNDFIGVLKDLDNAKTHPVFVRPKVSRGASLTSAQIARRDALLELVDMVEHCEKLPSTAAAERWVEQRLVRTVGRAKAVKAAQLKEMRKTRNRQRRRI